MPYLAEIVSMSIVGDDLANTRIVIRLGGWGEWIRARKMVRCCCQIPHLISSVPRQARAEGESGTGDSCKSCTALPLALPGRWQRCKQQHGGAMVIRAIYFLAFLRKEKVWLGGYDIFSALGLQNLPGVEKISYQIVHPAGLKIAPLK